MSGADCLSFAPSKTRTRFLLPAIGLSLFLAVLFLAPSLPAQSTNHQAQIDDLNSQINDAMDQVRKIVNQPIVGYRRQPDMSVSEFSPGWFHPGANTPDFNNVDIRTSQEKIYDRYEWVSSDLNPGVVFRGPDLEFNANTKYFYTNRSLPKKKLTEAEMVEINRLYRIIGHCQSEIARLQPPPAPVAQEPADQSTAEVIVDRYPLIKSPVFRTMLVVVLLVGVAFLIGKRVVTR